MKILGIGNAIVDVICKVEDSFLSDSDAPGYKVAGKHPRTATKMSRADVLAVHGYGGMSADEYDEYPDGDEPTGNVPYATKRFVPPHLRGTSGRGVLQAGEHFIEPELADEIPEEEWAERWGGYGHGGHDVPAEPVRKRRLKTKQSAHSRNLRRKIMPVMKMANFSLRKVSPGRYIVSARDVSQGVIEQIKALLQKIPGKRILVDGRIFGKQSAFREIIRVLRKNGTVEVSL